MKTIKICRSVTQDDIGRLSARLKPIRSRREVAGILGVSQALVYQIESSALSKILRVLIEHDNHGNNGESEENEEYKQNGESNHE